MAITYLTRTADEIAADRSIDTEYDDWGRQRYAEYRRAFDDARQRIANERATRNPALSKRLAEIHTLHNSSLKIAAQIRTANLMRLQDYRLTNDTEPTPFDYPLDYTGDTNMTYNSKYDRDAIEAQSNTPNISGKSPRENLMIEEAAQRRVAENPQWRIARELLHSDRDAIEVLTELGFTDIKEANHLFFTVTPPEGWTKSTEGYWTTILDADGDERISQFYKGAWYDERAFFRVNASPAE